MIRSLLATLPVCLTLALCSMAVPAHAQDATIRLRPGASIKLSVGAICRELSNRTDHGIPMPVGQFADSNQGRMALIRHMNRIPGISISPCAPEAPQGGAVRIGYDGATRTIAVGTATPSDMTYGFGPSPRSLDNISFFTESDPDLWRELQMAGFSALVLNPTFLMESEYGRGRIAAGGEYARRPVGTYLPDAALDRIADLQRAHHFEVHYEGGFGLSAENCDARLTAEQIGARAAQTDYAGAISRMAAAGIHVGTINLDGPFLRLIAGSRKNTACAIPTPRTGGLYEGRGFGVEKTVAAVRAYIRAIRELMEARGAPHPVTGSTAVQIGLTINLPNWQTGADHRDGNPSGAPTADLKKVMGEYAYQESRTGREASFDAIKIDYPWEYMNGDPALFVRRVTAIKDGLLDGDPDMRMPLLGLIVNTTQHRHGCVVAEGAGGIPFLPYLGASGPVSERCLAQQEEFDETRFLGRMLRYADRVRDGGDLAMALKEHGLRFEHLDFQSWNVNPVSNLWWAQRLVESSPG